MKKVNIEAESLCRMSKLDKYNEWLFAHIKDYLGNTVLEVGSGIGTYSQYLQGAKCLVLSDIEDKYLKSLKIKFKDAKNVRVKKINLTNNDLQKLKEYQLDTVVSINVFEHINADQKAVENIYKILPPGGRLLLVVPNHPFLYGSLDKHANHFRRYSKKQLVFLLNKAGFKITKIFTINFLGAISWFLQSRIFQRTIVSSTSLWLSEKFLFLAKFTDLINPFPIGLNIIVIATK